jgi:aspartate carbamoyltransferase catalytic subunit
MSAELRHLISINDLTNEEIEKIFETANRYLAELGDPDAPHRIAKSKRIGTGSILATLFYEPSTRTRLSFESAMLRLDGRTISSADPATSSAAKGESLADTARVVSNYADAIVIRHPRDGAAKLVAEYASVPVINGGDGAHEHPTQTLCDLFTLQREKGAFKGLNVVISGDLKGSRTIHSFVYALARFGAHIMLMPGGKGMELPAHVDWRLRHEFHALPVPREKYEKENADIDVLYATAEQPHQPTLLSASDFKEIDIFYMTRFQKERYAEGAKADYMKVDSNFLNESKYKSASVMHPLPRVGELDADLDGTPRAAYFRQASYGVPIRMALISAVLELDAQNNLEKFAHGFRTAKHPVHTQPRELGIACPNTNCITHDPHDGSYAGNKFTVVTEDGLRLRCYYCETDVKADIVGHAHSKLYEHSASIRDLQDTVFFANEADAQKAGFKPGARNHAAAE